MPLKNKDIQMWKTQKGCIRMKEVVEFAMILTK